MVEISHCVFGISFYAESCCCCPFRVVFPCLPWKRERETALLLLLLRQNRKRNFSRIFLAFVAAERLSNGFSVHYYIATGQSSHYQRPFHDLQLIYWRTRGRHRLKNAITCFSAFSREAEYSNLPKKRTGTITEFWEKTLIDVSRLFLASENYFDWLTWFLVLLRTERQESRQSIEMIFTAQK